MKKFFNFFVLAVVLAIVATSCYKDDINNLQKQIDALKSGEIATIETQISSINTSITELKSVDNTLKEYITALQSDSKKYAQQIADLTAMDKTLETKIADLQKYVDSGIKDTKDWASATFATLDQMDSVATVVAKVVVGVKQISENLDSLKKEVTSGYTKAIEAATSKLEVSMKKWVSEQLTDYYTIAQINATLDSLGKKQFDIDSAMVEKIKEQQVALDTAKSQITAAYKKAIQVAIDSLQGKFDIKIATEIATAKNALQTQIDTISGEISNIKGRLATAENNIAALVNQIQSIVVIPTYSDGSVEVTGEVDTICFDIYPTDVADSIAKAWKNSDSTTRANMVSFKIKGVTTKGQAVASANVDTVFFNDGAFKVGVKFNNLPKTAVASLHIAYGKTDVASSYFVLNKLNIPEGSLKGVFSVSATKKVRFSKGNLQATLNANGVPNEWNFAENQYDFIGNATANTTIGSEAGVVDLFGWSVDTTYNTFGIHTKTESTNGYTNGSFKDWGKNAIANGGNEADLWRTLSKEEWQYLLNYPTCPTPARTDANRFARAMVNGVRGLIIFPDGYNGGIAISGIQGIASELNKSTQGPFPSESVAPATWTSMETAGCVFLPAAYIRQGLGVDTTYYVSCYWSSTPNNETEAFCLYFGNSSLSVENRKRYQGCSVRLVCDVQ